MPPTRRAGKSEVLSVRRSRCGRALRPVGAWWSASFTRAGRGAGADRKKMEDEKVEKEDEKEGSVTEESICIGSLCIPDSASDAHVCVSSGDCVCATGR